MRDRRKRNNDDNDVDLEKLAFTVSVSLFMTILAFFIVLNSFSANSGIKLRSLHDSIANTFGFVGTGRSDVATGESGTGGVGQSEEKTAGSLRSVLPDLGFETRHTAGGQVMTVRIARADMDERWPDLRARLADVLNSRAGGGKPELQIVALDGAAGAADLARYGADLEADGVDAEKIALGFDARGRTDIELRFVMMER